MMHSRFVRGSRPTRRSVFKAAALGSVAAIAAPYIKHTSAAGTLSIAAWDHWIPGANGALTALCNEWSAKNNVEVRIDYITSQGEKLTLTAAAEAQAGTGHDLMHHLVWNIGVHASKLEPLDEIAGELINNYGPISPEFEYLGKINGTWRGIPATRLCAVYPCCSRLDLYKHYAGIDLPDIFPADESQWDRAKLDTWNWDTYLTSAEKLYRAGYPVGLPMGQTNDSVNWVGALFRAYGVVMVDANDHIRVNSDETRAALEYLKKLMAANPPEVYAWDDAGNNRWLISGKGSGIINPPSAWVVARRDNPKVAENCWHHPMPKGPKGRFAAQLPSFYGLWSFSKNKSAAKELLLYLSQKPAVTRLVEASLGYDLPAFNTMHDLDIWRTVGPPVGTVYGYPPRGDKQTSIAGAPARTEVGAQIYNQAVNAVMVSKVTQGGEKLDDVIKWAERELEGMLHA